MDDRETAAVRALIEGTSDTAGAAAGAAFGLIGGLPGVVAGAAGGVLLARGFRRVAVEINDRWLAPRERIRVADVYTLAAEAISARILAGDDLRSDGFFDSTGGGRSPAEELLEGVLLQARDRYEEQRLRYLAWFYASLAFDGTVTPGYANYLLRVVNGLTYGQLVCLALVASPGHAEEKIRADALRQEGGAPDSAAAVRTQIADLGRTDLAAATDRGVSLAGTGTQSQLLAIAPLELLPMGLDVYRLMRLDQVPLAAIDDLIVQLGVGRDI